MTITVRSLHVYPIKSCAGIDLLESTIDMAGLAHDRRWLLVGDDGMFLTQRAEPRMVLIRPRFDQDWLCVEAPGMPVLRLPLYCDGGANLADKTVTVWRDTMLAGDEGQDAADWFSHFLKRSLRLVRADKRTRRVANQQRVTNWQDRYGVLAPDMPADNLFRFADGFPLLLTSQASLDVFNARLQEQGTAPVAMTRFRPNIVLDGLDAYDEDHLAMLTIGQVRLPVVKPCSRCPIPNIDPQTAEKNESIGRTLSSYRTTADGVIFGQNALVQAPAGAVLHAGDRCEPSWTF